VTLFSEVPSGHSPAAYLLRNSAYGTAFPRNTNIGETFRMLPGYSVSGLERVTPRTQTPIENFQDRRLRHFRLRRSRVARDQAL
jgi:hypothetical protein